ncbi:MAG: NUDIX hydrolase [Cyanobacteriota bacterium]|jgi:ADP-ribose pyrophosphatase
MAPSQPDTHERLAIEAELAAGDCRFVRERLRLPMGLEASFGWLRHPPTVLVVPHRADGRVLLVRRYRPAVGRWVVEFPCGPLGPGESPAEGGARLARELAGQGGGSWRTLGVLRPNPGYSDERMTVGLWEVEGPEGQPADAGEGSGWRVWRPTAPELEAFLSDVEEAVDGRVVSAWFLARSHWRV